MEKDFMNPPMNPSETVTELSKHAVVSIYGNRVTAAIPSENMILINNLLNAIVKCTNIPKEQYEDWLKQEIGMDDRKIAELKRFQCFPEPAA